MKVFKARPLVPLAERSEQDCSKQQEQTGMSTMQGGDESVVSTGLSYKPNQLTWVQRANAKPVTVVRINHGKS